MSENGEKPAPATEDGVTLAVIVLATVMLVLSTGQSCRTRMQYEDLRERLERLEQKQ